MTKFDTTKKGYDTMQVDDYLHSLILKYEEKLSEQKDRVVALKNELEITQNKLQGYIDKDEQISKALVMAVEKAEQIENSAKNIYDLEIKRVRLLYHRWEELLNAVEAKCPNINTNQYLNQLMNDFKDSIDDVLQQNFKLTNKPKSLKDDLRKAGDNHIKNILNRMDYQMNGNPKPNTLPLEEPEVLVKQKVAVEHKKENNRLSNISSKLNSINKKMNIGKGENLVDKFLNSDSDDLFPGNAYAKNIAKSNVKKNESPFNFAYPTPNESGFDLKEALNPKEDLDEIMKSFDFFNNKNNKE